MKGIDIFVKIFLNAEGQGIKPLEVQEASSLHLKIHYTTSTQLAA